MFTEALVGDTTEPPGVTSAGFDAKLDELHKIRAKAARRPMSLKAACGAWRLVRAGRRLDDNRGRSADR